MKLYPFLIYSLLWAFPYTLSGQQNIGIAQHFEQQMAIFPQEKLHLHIDRTVYVPGERIWFKAYLTDAISHEPVIYSRYIYVELINSADSAVHRVIIHPDEDGMYYGHLFLSEMIPDGTYTIRAYTRYMENLGEGYFFTKNIRIRNLQAPSPSVRAGVRSDEVDDYDVALMPEGGNLLTGQLCKVAFKAQNRNGASDYITGKLVDESGSQLCSINTHYAGMGSFAFIPESGKKYFLQCSNFNGTKKTFELPASKDTYAVVTAWRKLDNQHLVSVDKSNGSPEKPLYLLVHSSGVLLYFSTWDYLNNLVSFQGNELPSGIIHFLLFDEGLNPLSERLVFNKNMKQDRAEVLFSTDSPEYGKRDRVIAELSLMDFEGNRLEGNLSVSITDNTDMEIDSLTTILSSLLLSSELKGHIETPAYYLQDNTYSEMALDLLMMTHGWRRYNIPEVVKGIYKIPQIDFESSKEITGTVKTLYMGRPIADSEVTIVSSDGEFTIAITDSLGRFSIYGLEYPDSAWFMVKATNRRGSENVELFVDDEKFPKYFHVPESQSLTIFANNLLVNVEKNDSTLLAIEQVKTESKMDEFLNKAAHRAQYDKDIRVINLNEVVVNARRIERKDEERLKDWRNSLSDLTINREFIENTKPISIFHALLNVSGVVIYMDSLGQQQVTIRGAQPIIYINGVRVPYDYLQTIDFLNEVESVDVFKTLASSAAAFGLGTSGNPALNITLRTGKSDGDGWDQPRYNFATITPLGYQVPVEFYSPIYEMPESKYLGNPDYRTTIFWKPDILISESGRASFEFYASDFPATYSVVIEGISNDGKIIRHVDKIEVK